MSLIDTLLGYTAIVFSDARGLVVDFISLVWTAAKVTDTAGHQYSRHFCVALSPLSIIFRFHFIDSSPAGVNCVLLIWPFCSRVQYFWHQFLILSLTACIGSACRDTAIIHHTTTYPDSVILIPVFRHRNIGRPGNIWSVHLDRQWAVLSPAPCHVIHPTSGILSLARRKVTTIYLIVHVATEMGNCRPTRLHIQTYSVWRPARWTVVSLAACFLQINWLIDWLIDYWDFPLSTSTEQT